MRLLITGGAGFIGSNFVRYILKKYPGYGIVNLDKLTYAGNLENLADIEGDSRHEFVHGDICDPDCVHKLMSGSVDAVVNFAAESHVDRSILDSSEFVRTNIEGTRNLLDISRRNKIGRYIQISTDEVYGSLGDSGAFTEETPIAPNSPYSASKAAADLLVRSYCHTHGFPAVITRCSNNYGPCQFPEKLIPLLVSNAMSDIPLPIYGDGMNVRDWIHVEDHCAAIDAVLHRGETGEVYNVGGRQEIPNIEVARRILAALGKSESLLTYVEDRPGHDRRYAIDSTKIETELDWKPRITFAAGLPETIAWYRRNASWMERVRSGAYLKYYDDMYGRRKQTLSAR
ncbi:MAG: dTDP-glucose 4,6-dehydratase [Acidobacteriota bacterium]|jgi:dTDP-glucose 4,6-dehydratase|nr:dTDP-glucose 4,6-dehydratase [Acidobacteriota bacterium]